LGIGKITEELPESINNVIEAASIDFYKYAFLP
jgi:cation transport regulator ChaB